MSIHFVLDVVFPFVVLIGCWGTFYPRAPLWGRIYLGMNTAIFSWLLSLALSDPLVPTHTKVIYSVVLGLNVALTFWAIFSWLCLRPSREDAA